jgi:hypothetical protein
MARVEFDRVLRQRRAVERPTQRLGQRDEPLRPKRRGRAAAPMDRAHFLPRGMSDSVAFAESSRSHCAYAEAPTAAVKCVG